MQESQWPHYFPNLWHTASRAKLGRWIQQNVPSELWDSEIQNCSLRIRGLGAGAPWSQNVSKMTPSNGYKRVAFWGSKKIGPLMVGISIFGSWSSPLSPKSWTPPPFFFFFLDPINGRPRLHHWRSCSSTDSFSACQDSLRWCTQIQLSALLPLHCACIFLDALCVFDLFFFHLSGNVGTEGNLQVPATRLWGKQKKGTFLCLVVCGGAA